MVRGVIEMVGLSLLCCGPTDGFVTLARFICPWWCNGKMEGDFNGYDSDSSWNLEDQATKAKDFSNKRRFSFS